MEINNGTPNQSNKGSHHGSFNKKRLIHRSHTKKISPSNKKYSSNVVGNALKLSDGFAIKKDC